MTEKKLLIKSIVGHKHKHGRFLNTLALMELSGAQKISRYLASTAASTFLLEHAAEEYRHAYFLRKLANKVSDINFTSFSSEYIFCEYETRQYIRHLDRRICLLFPKYQIYDISRQKTRAYLLCTLAVENRAMAFYQMYQDILDEENLNLSLRSILSEEESHLASISKLVELDPVIKPLIEASFSIEEKLFEAWVSALQKQLGIAHKKPNCDSYTAVLRA